MAGVSPVNFVSVPGWNLRDPAEATEYEYFGFVILKFGFLGCGFGLPQPVIHKRAGIERRIPRVLYIIWLFILFVSIIDKTI